MVRNSSRSFASMVPTRRRIVRNSQKGKAHSSRPQSRVRASSSMNDELRERINVGLQEDQHPDQASQGNAVPEDVSQNATLVSVPFRGGAGNDDALGIDHLAHYSATAVCRRHQDRRDADLGRRNLLQTPEQNV